MKANACPNGHIISFSTDRAAISNAKTSSVNGRKLSAVIVIEVDVWTAVVEPIYTAKG